MLSCKQLSYKMFSYYQDLLSQANIYQYEIAMTLVLEISPNMSIAGSIAQQFLSI